MVTELLCQAVIGHRAVVSGCDWSPGWAGLDPVVKLAGRVKRGLAIAGRHSAAPTVVLAADQVLCALQSEVRAEISKLAITRSVLIADNTSTGLSSRSFTSLACFFGNLS